MSSVAEALAEAGVEPAFREAAGQHCCTKLKIGLRHLFSSFYLEILRLSDRVSDLVYKEKIFPSVNFNPMKVNGRLLFSLKKHLDLLNPKVSGHVL